MCAVQEPVLPERVEEPRTRALATLMSCPPGRPFHLFVAIPAAALLYSVSLPGVAFFTGMAAGFALLVAAGIWTLRAFTYVIARRRKKAAGDARLFLIAPVGGVLVLLLLAGSVPLRLRWTASQPAFNAIVEDVQPTTSLDEIVDLPVGSRVGLYRIRYAYQQGDAVIFYEATGALIDDAGFAYLPSGPFPELESGSFERPQFRHLTGDWYAWTASW